MSPPVPREESQGHPGPLPLLVSILVYSLITVSTPLWPSSRTSPYISTGSEFSTLDHHRNPPLPPKLQQLHWFSVQPRIQQSSFMLSNPSTTSALWSFQSDPHCKTVLQISILSAPELSVAPPTNSRTHSHLRIQTSSLPLEQNSNLNCSNSHTPCVSTTSSMLSCLLLLILFLTCLLFSVLEGSAEYYYY